MSRRMTKPLEALVLLVALIAAALPLHATAAVEADDDRPNVLIILTDDQRAAGTMTVMPRTRKLFRRTGTHFPNTFATTPVCCPSRASIFTGLYAHNHGVHTNQAGEGEKLDQSRTIQRYLQESGYRTALFGKYFNKWDLARSPHYFHEWAIHNKGFRDATWNVQGELRVIPGYVTSYLRTTAVDFLRRASAEEAPWMLFLSPFAPHAPSIAAERFERADVPPFKPNPATLEVDEDPGGLSDKPPFVQQQDHPSVTQSARLQRKQLRTLVSVDILVKKVMEAVKETGEDDNTIAFFLSDNGLQWGENGVRGKGVPYTSSVRLPLFARWPGGFAEGVADERLAANIDIAPTVMEAAGIVPESEMDGNSLLGPDTRDRLLIEAFGALSKPNLFWASTRTLDYQYTEWYFDSFHVAPNFVEHYDLVTDPYQLQNTLVDRDTTNDPDVTELSAQLREDKTCRGPSCP